MTSEFLLFDNVSFSYTAASERILNGFSASIPAGWMGLVGANGAGKTTILKLACGQLEPDSGGLRRPGEAVYCPQRTDAPPERFAELLAAADAFASRIRERLEIEHDWIERWPSLSHGERKRAQIGAAFFAQPAVLALDEPTNHIDADGRAMLLSVLREYRGIGLLVSHDRELLDTLCERCLFLDPPEAVMRPGPYTSGRREAAREEESARERKELARQQAERLRKEALRRRDQARSVERGLSKKRLARGDHDGKGLIDLARLTGVDGKSAKLAARMQSRFEKAARNADGIKVRKRYEMGIWFEGERCRRDALFQLPAGTISLGNGRWLVHPELIMRPGDRLALTGANGTGKSTLIRRILEAVDLPPDRLTYLPQEIDLRSSRDILAEVRGQPPEVLGRIMNAVSRLGSRPAGLLSTAEPSPGELRKLLLALGIARKPYLIIMDEPTNHLDLPSIECLEEALADCPCGLLLVSHDEPLLSRLTRKRWHIVRTRAAGRDETALSVS